MEKLRPGRTEDGKMNNTNSETESSATFVVRVGRKPGKPWKGKVTCVDERRQQEFDNVQELMTLMDSSLQPEKDPEE